MILLGAMICFFGLLMIDFREETNFREMVREKGTNAIPMLLDMLRAKDSKLKQTFISLSEKQRIVRFRLKNAATWHAIGETGFRDLGTNGAGAAPGLIRIYEEKISSSSQQAVFRSLINIGNASTDVIISRLQQSGSTNAELSWLAMRLLKYRGAKPEIMVPVLAQSLANTNAELRLTAAIGLWELGEKAAPAAPALLRALNDPEPQVRQAATNALKKIDPEAAAKAGIK